MNRKGKQEKKQKQKGLIFKIGSRYLDKNISKIQVNAKIQYVLTVEQKTALKKIRFKTYTLSAIIGAVAVLIVIIPFHLFDFFQPQHLEILDYSFDVELYYIIYAVIMIFPEIWLLNAVNIRAVRHLCEVYQYPNIHHKDYNEQVAILTEAGLEIPNKNMELLGIDPYIGLSKFSYYVLFALAKLKAALSNVLMKLIVRRLLGRYALRIVMDLMGVPVYAFWDAWASHQVLKEAQVRITSTTASKDYIGKFTKDELLSIIDVYPLLVNYIAQQKRAYNFSLYAFIKELSYHYPPVSLKIERVVQLKELFGEDSAKNKIIAQLLIFGFIIDGHLSVKEKLDIHKLAKEDWFPLTLEEIETMLQNYIQGEEGEERLFTP